MGSNIYATECPCCGRSAIEDYYYKTGEYYTSCIRCGYYYSRTIESYSKEGIEFREEVNGGNGVFVLVNKDGNRKNILLDSIITDDQLEKFKKSFVDDEVNQEKSYLVSYKDGAFSILLGHPPENFYLAFDEYRDKMFAKYGKSEYEFMVPIEE